MLTAKAELFEGSEEAETEAELDPPGLCPQAATIPSVRIEANRLCAVAIERMADRSYDALDASTRALDGLEPRLTVPA